MIETETPVEAFAINSMERLAWYGRKLTAIDDQIRHIRANAEAMIADLEQEKKSLTDRFGSQAENCAMSILQATKAKTKTLKTLGGSFSFRTVPGGLRKADPVAVLEWAKTEAPGLVKRTEIVKEDVPAEAIKTHWQETGEIPPGCELVPDRQTFTHKQEV